MAELVDWMHHESVTRAGTNTANSTIGQPFGNGVDVCPVCGKPSTIGKPQTNADCIRAMTDEELAEFLDKWEAKDIDYSLTFCNMCKGEMYDCHKDCLMQWLKKEVDG